MKNRLVIVLAIVLGIGLITAYFIATHRKSAWPMVASFNVDMPEGSGIIYYPSRQTFFVAGDNGDVAEVKKDGTIIQEINLEHANFEGITYNPLSGLLYLVIEGEDRILEVAPDRLTALREFSVSRKFEKHKVTVPGKHGFEGIAFVPKTDRPEGGTFFVVNQVMDDSKNKEASAILEIELPLKSADAKAADKKSTEGKIINVYPMKINDLSDIFYDAATDRLLVLSDHDNSVSEMTRAGKILAEHSIPGVYQEGITLDSEGNMYIAEDQHPSSMILKLKR